MGGSSQEDLPWCRAVAAGQCPARNAHSVGTDLYTHQVQAPQGWGTAASWLEVEATAPQPWDIAGLLATFSGEAPCQGSRAEQAMQPN